MSIVGDDSNNVLNGTAGDDEIYGLGGNDLIRGAAGSDVIDGGVGDDQLYGDEGADILYGGIGRDQLFGGDANDEIYGQDGADQLDGMNGNDELYGGGGADRLLGGIGADQLYGDSGNDILAGGSGADFIYGADGSDTLDYGGSLAGVKIDLANGTASGGDAAGDHFESIENAIGTAFDDVLIGGPLAARLEGGAGADQISASGSSNMLFGGDGNDVLQAGLHDNVIDGGAGNDIITTGDRATILAGDGNDLVTAGSFTGLSADGGGGQDKITLSGAGLGIFYMATGVGYDSSGQIAGTAKGFEIIDFWYGGNLRVVGTGAADAIYVHSGNVTFVGGAGDDLLVGGTVLLGLSGSGIFQGGAGADTMTGFSPDFGGALDDVFFDYLSYETSPSGVSVDMVIGKGFGGDAQGDTFSAMNGILGSEYGDTLRGAAGNNSLYGMSGADVIIGGAGADRLVGGVGADTFVYESSSDSGLGNAADMITDFSRTQGDKINLGAIDADGNANNGNSSFIFRGFAPFTGVAGELILQQSGTTLIVAADINGDQKADMSIKLSAISSLTASDFFL